MTAHRDCMRRTTNCGERHETVCFRVPPVVSATLVLAMLAALSACRDLDVVTASYATLAEAREAGAIARGWVPDGLPESVYELREAHDLDSNRRWGLFSFPATAREGLKALLDAETSLDGITCDIPARIEWWPVLLRGTLDAERIRTTGLRAYGGLDGELLFVVQWNQGRAYYWSLDSARPIDD